MNLGFLGTGTITSAIVTGLSTTAKPALSILLSPRNAANAAGLAARFPHVAVATSNQEVLDRSDTVVVAVRPQIAQNVLSEMRFRPDHHVISLVSGFSVRRLAHLVAPAPGATRVVPLPATAKLRSPTAIYPRDPVAVDLFAPLGAAFEVNSETEFDALCTASATMATYFTFAGAAASWLTRQGVPQPAARDYIARVFSGLGQTAMELPGQSFEALAADHATRGGTNEQVVNHLTRNGVFETFSEALDGVMQRVTAATSLSD